MLARLHDRLGSPYHYTSLILYFFTKKDYAQHLDRQHVVFHGDLPEWEYGMKKGDVGSKTF
jgi:hypothetical protein